MKNFIQKLKYLLLGSLMIIASPIMAVQISVPSASNSGYFLVSTSTGNYIATTSSPLLVGSIIATSTTATSTFAGNVKVSGNLEVTGVSLLSLVTSGAFTSTGLITGTSFTASSNTASNFPYASTTSITSSGYAAFATSGGNVGIGTTNPTQKLHIVGSGQPLEIIGSNDTSAVYTRFGTSAQTGMGYLGAEGSSAGSTLTNTLAYASFLSSGASGTALQFGTAGAIKMTILSGGNVGIGTTNPARVLDVQGATSALMRLNNTSGADATLEFYDNTNTRMGYVEAQTGAMDMYSTSGFLRFYANGAEKMRIQTDGNVGIGTTNPINALEVVNSSNAAATYPLRINNSTDGALGSAQIVFNVSSGSTFADNSASIGLQRTNLVSGGDGDLLFQTKGSGTLSEKMRILSNGNVGIGTTGPLASLDIQASGSSVSPLFAKNSSGSNMFRINSDGSTESYLSTDLSSVGGIVNSFASGTGIELTSSSGTQYWMSIAPKINQSSTAGYTALLVNSTETATGSGTKLLADFQTGGTSRMVVQSGGNIGIATTSPWGTLSITGNTSTNPFIISTTTATNASSTLFMVDKGGWVHYGGGTPALSSCGTGPTLDANSTDQAGTVTFGTGATGCTITFAQPAPTSPHCVVTPRAISLVNAYTVAPTVNSIVITQAASGGTVWDYFCPLGH